MDDVLNLYRNVQANSHPNKLLINHINGILQYADNSAMSKMCILFHDLGKTNPYFQEKLKKLDHNKYNNHSYLSSYILLNCLENNNKLEFDDRMMLLSNIIVGHHSYLRNLGELFKQDEWNKMISFLKENDISEFINNFLITHKSQYFNFIFSNDYENNELYKRIGNYSSHNDRTLSNYRDNCLEYYFDTLYSYSNLVYGDRKDASENKQLKRTNESKIRLCYSLQNNLNHTFNKFTNSPINTIRSDIRTEAKKTLISNLNKSRCFSLTAPTGSGKTLMLLDLALSINEQNDYQYDIIYALPFLSIIDQTCDIIENKLMIDILKFSSTAETSNQLQKLLENNYNNNNISEIVFNENSFDENFILTTFVQLFETFLSNKTSKCLKLRNFSKRIFLIDEIQSLPKTLYKVFYYMINHFCQKCDSYVIISSATMPDFNISKDSQDVKNIFKNLNKPIELVDQNIFNNDIFNRYDIKYIGECMLNDISEKLFNHNRSVLCIANTKITSFEIYDKCITINKSNNKFEKIYLLNTLITPYHRIKKINQIKEDIKNNTKILVISTQLIEAGVDIDFPIVYRDAAPPSSIVQSGGRCNRNGNLYGHLFIFMFKREDCKYECDFIYHGISNLYKKYNEPIKTEAKYRQNLERHFSQINKYSTTGYINDKTNIINLLKDGKFEDIGKIKLIENEDSYTIFVGEDELWTKYKKQYDKCILENNQYNKINLEKIKREIIQYCINITKESFEKKYDYIQTENEEILGIKKCINKDEIYNENTGIF